jgi:hypothetical protein
MAPASSPKRTMADERKKLSRREALKTIAAGTAATLPIVGADLGAEDHAAHQAPPVSAARRESEAAPRFFTATEMATIAAATDRILPRDERSPGAREAGVPAFIDLMVSESPDETKVLWRDGLKAVEAKSRTELEKSFVDATPEEADRLLADIARNERRPRTLEERFFRAMKNLTVDGYYTSEIGIQKELRYKGNAYLKEFKGCTHPEHQG